MVYSSLFDNTELNERAIEARLLYIGLIVLADDDGRLRYDPHVLKGKIFSHDEKISVSEVEKWLSELSDLKQICIYERDGVKVIKHPNWLKYQRIRADLYEPSKLPAPLRTRNVDVTEPSLKIRKDKISKDNITSDEGSSRNEAIVKIINSFVSVDPKNKTYYANITQRNAAGYLVDTYGLDSVLKRIEVLPKTNKVPFFPKIYTPVQLKEKWVDLEDTVARKRSETKIKSTVAFS